MMLPLLLDQDFIALLNPVKSIFIDRIIDMIDKLLDISLKGDEEFASLNHAGRILNQLGFELIF